MENQTSPLSRQYLQRPLVACMFAGLLQLVAPINASAQDAPKTGFDIFEYQVQGVSRLSDMDIEKAVEPFLGLGKSFADVDAARANLEKAYHDAGYLTVLVTIPEQKVDQAVVILQVQEVAVDRLKVANSEYHVPSVIKGKIPELAEGNVPNFNEMQKQLANVNRNPDLKVTPVLRAGQSNGAIEAELDVDDQLPVHGTLELSNRQSPNTTPLRLSGSIRYDNLFQAGQSLGLSVQLSPQKTDEVRVLSGTYVIPVGEDGNAYTIYAVHSRSSLATIYNSPGLGVLGNTDILGARYSISFPQIETYPQSLSLGADWKRVKQLVTSAAGSQDTPINYVPLVASYTGNLLDAERPTTVDASLTMGVRGLLGNTESEFLAKRAPGGSANFLVLHGDVQHTETLWKWKLFSKFDFQAASGPLINSEQFTAGGVDSVRGYLEGEVIGDDAIHGTIELRTPEYKLAGQTSSWSMTGLGFWDAALLHTSFAPTSQPTNQNIHSAGIGAQLTAPRGFSMQVYWAHAFDNAQLTKAGSNRVEAHLEWDY